MKGLLSGFLLALASSACVTTTSLSSSTESLAGRTERFYQELRDDRADQHLVRDAAALAAAAHGLDSAVQRRESREDLDDEFDRVAEHYHHLREYYDGRRGREHDDDDDDDDDDHDADHHHDIGAADRFAAVTEAYLEVEGALKYRETRHAEADDRRRY